MEVSRVPTELSHIEQTATLLSSILGDHSLLCTWFSNSIERLMGPVPIKAQAPGGKVLVLFAAIYTAPRTTPGTH